MFSILEMNNFVWKWRCYRFYSSVKTEFGMHNCYEEGIGLINIYGNNLDR